ncbi:MAG: branched-chain amino acid ABC transporter substrate-binding protein, partial [Actinobacteria bacterium]|nr:branched-chain amino acid ABC transporter substrate-binding protein [Actinomycetota bacterium]
MSTARRAICVLLISAVAGAACGGSGEQAAPTTAAAPTESTVAPDPGTAPVAAGNFGDLVGVCGPGSAKGATAQGVTDSQIEVGTVSDPGNSIIPGLNQELFDAADAFVGWCNGAGGILGRTIKLNKRDAKLMEAGPRTVEACQTDFMLVGNGAA